MISRRVQPLLVLFVLGALVILARLFEIQVAESAIWKHQAARLVHSGRDVPYHRGRILDAQGRVLARDLDSLELVLVYRDFRRGHPLGQIAHARSILEGRAVSLREARANLRAWALELVRLSPRALEEFAGGGGLRLPSLELEPVPSGEEEARRARASDLGFYVKRLFGLDPPELRGLERRSRDEDGRARPFLELAALELARGSTPDPAGALRRVEQRVERSLASLERLAGLVAWKEDPAAPRPPLERLLAELEEARAWVEDATASKLFGEASGFAPGRVAPETLCAAFDLRWIASELCWDGERLERWAVRAREGWLAGWRDGYALPHLAWNLVLDPARSPNALDVLARALCVLGPEGSVEACLDGRAPDPRLPISLEVFEELDELFIAEPPVGALPTVAEILPLPLSELERVERDAEVDWSLLDRCWNAPAPETCSGSETARSLGGRRPADVEALVLSLARRLDDWDAGIQQALRESLERTLRASDPDARSADGRLSFERGRRTRARERAEFFWKDYGTRPWPLLDEPPSYDVVYLLARYEQDYAGFVVRERRTREVHVAAGDRASLAAEIIGQVSSVGVRDLVSQRPTARRLRELMGLPERSDAEELELERLLGSVLLEDEVRGVSGIEAFLQPELVGRNGYRESRGLEDVFGKGVASAAREPENGRDVALTLDLDLQRAAVRTLQSPPAVSDDPDYDWEWYVNPVGAVVLLASDGDVLAASSEPNASSEIAEDARGQRAVLYERTLQKPTFQPPGSVVKPFFSAYALSEVGLDPRSIVTCGPIARGGVGYKDVRCHSISGHGDVSLDQALVRSCNAYFAWLGETLSDADLRAAARLFGFGEPTGVRRAPPGGAGALPRKGLIEHTAGVRAGAALNDFDRRLVANGLGPVEATPMQLARAMLALATGELVELRLVKSVGGEEMPRGRRERLALRESALERVRADLSDVAADPGGTAHAALAPGILGFRVAVKTGSADLAARADDGGTRVVPKHTWVAGWLPPEKPELVFVVFVHDTSATSSHGAIYVARELLTQPEVLNWLVAHGVDVSGVPAR